jgi:hypothetical protein
MSRKERIELKNLHLIQVEDTNMKKHERRRRRSNKIRSNHQVDQVDIKSFLNRLGWFLDQDKVVNEKRSTSIMLIQVLTLIIPWTWILKSTFLLCINDKSEWNYILGEFSPAFGKNLISL